MVPKDWQVRKLGSILDKVSDTVQVNPDTEYQEIGIRSHGKGIFYKEPVLGAMLGDKRVFWVKPDALIVNIVFAWEQAVARTTSRDHGLIASHRFPMFRPKEGLCDIDYLVHFFKTKRGKALLEFASPGGAGRNKTLGMKEFFNLSITVPPREEQTKIAAILTTWDNAMATTEKIIEMSRIQKNTLMQKILANKNTLCGLSDHWEVKELREIATMSSGGTPKTTEPSYFGGNIPWVSISDMTKNGKYLRSTERTLTAEGIANSSARIFPKGTILYAMYASIGECSIADTRLATSQAILGITPSEHISSEFLYYFLSSQKEKIRIKGQQGTQSNLNSAMVKELAIKVPSLKVQDRIVNIFNCFDEGICLLEKELEILKLEKRALTLQLFSGERRVEVGNNAVA